MGPPGLFEDFSSIEVRSITNFEIVYTIKERSVIRCLYFKQNQLLFHVLRQKGTASDTLK